MAEDKTDSADGQFADTTEDKEPVKQTAQMELLTVWTTELGPILAAAAEGRLPNGLEIRDVVHRFLQNYEKVLDEESEAYRELIPLLNEILEEQALCKAEMEKSLDSMQPQAVDIGKRILTAVSSSKGRFDRAHRVVGLSWSAGIDWIPDLAQLCPSNDPEIEVAVKAFLASAAREEDARHEHRAKLQEVQKATVQFIEHFHDRLE